MDQIENLSKVQNNEPLDTVNIAKAADLLNCSTDLIRGLIEDGSLPAYRMGKRLIRIKRVDLEKLFRIIPSAATK